MAARKKKLHLSESWKDKIRTGVIIQRLMKCAEGKDEMTANQLKAADILLKKVAPDLARTELQPLDANGEKSNGFNININHVKPDAKA